VLAGLTEEFAHLTSLSRPSELEAERIGEVRKLLRSADATIKPDDGLVEPGMQITALLSGDTISYLAPSGNPMTVEILAAAPYAG
jgi:transcription elongation factor GreA